MIDLGVPLADHDDRPTVFSDATTPRLRRAVPVRLGLRLVAPDVPELSLTIVGPLDGPESAVLGGAVTLVGPDDPEAVPEPPARARARVRAVTVAGAPPLSTPWLEVAGEAGTVTLPGVTLDGDAARIVAHEITTVAQHASLTAVEVVVDLRARRRALPARVEIDAEVLVALGERIGSQELPLDRLYAVLQEAVVADGGGIRVRSVGPSAGVELRREIVHRLAELGGVEAVVGTGPELAATTVSWSPSLTTGTHLADLSLPGAAVLRRGLATPVATLLDGFSEAARETVVRRHHAVALARHHTIAVTVASHLDPSVGTVVGEVRHHRGAELVADTFRFDGTGPRTVPLHGHRHLVPAERAEWSVALRPGPVLVQAGVRGPVVREGELALDGVARLHLSLGTFGIAFASLTVSDRVAATVVGWEARLRSRGATVVTSGERSAPGVAVLPAPEGVEPGATALQALVRAGPADEPVVVLDEPDAVGRDLQLGWGHLLAEDARVTVWLEGADAAEVLAVFVTVRAPTGPPALLELRPDEEPRHWAHPRRTVLESPEYRWSERWIRRGAPPVDVPERTDTARELVIRPPA